MKPLGRTNIQAMPEPSMSFFPARCHRCSRLAAASSAPGRSHDRAVPFAQLQRQRGQRVQALHAKQSRVEGLRLVHVTDHELHAGAQLAGCRPLRHAPGREPANPPSRAERRRGGRPSRSRRSPGSPVSYTHLRAHETPEHLVCRLLLEKKKKHNLLNNLTTFYTKI